MKPTELTREYVISNYVRPARLRGERTVAVRVGNVQKELGWTNRTPSVFSTLTSQEFQDQAGVQLVEKRGGPPSGGPSTTWQFVYRILDESSPSQPENRSVQRPRGGLLALYGIAKDLYEEVGGGETFIQSERKNFGSIVPEDWDEQGAKETE